MRVGIATVQVPFVRGGAEFLAESLRHQIRLAGHEAEILSVPFRWYPPDRILDHMLACRLLDVGESCHVRTDLVIGLKFPAYLVPHPNKVLWLLHQHRGAYDMWDLGIGDLRHAPDGAGIRQAVRAADARGIPEARACYTISRNVTDRLSRYCGLPSVPLYHPPPGHEALHCAEYGDYFLLPSRINPGKRQHLVLAALALTREPCRVVFMGPPDDPAEGAALAAATEADDRLRDRVAWTGGVTDAQRVAHYAGCLAVLFPAQDEDYGYVTLEAMLSRKAVVTCADSGGPLEFVRDGLTGAVCGPTAEELAAAMDALWRDRALARAQGEAGHARYRAMDISWDSVLRHLLG